MSNLDPYAPVPPSQPEKEDIVFGYEGFQQVPEEAPEPPVAAPVSPYAPAQAQQPYQPAQGQNAQYANPAAQGYQTYPAYQEVKDVPKVQSKAALYYFFISIGVLAIDLFLIPLISFVARDNVPPVVVFILGLLTFIAGLGLFITGFILKSKSKKLGEKQVFWVLGIVASGLSSMGKIALILVAAILIFGVIASIQTGA